MSLSLTTGGRSVGRSIARLVGQLLVRSARQLLGRPTIGCSYNGHLALHNVAPTRSLNPCTHAAVAAAVTAAAPVGLSELGSPSWCSRPISMCLTWRRDKPHLLSNTNNWGAHDVRGGTYEGGVVFPHASTLPLACSVEMHRR